MRTGPRYRDWGPTATAPRILGADHMGNDEASVLRAFDDNRKAIHVAAVRAYKRERRKFYELGASDFDAPCAARLPSRNGSWRAGIPI